MAGQRQPIGNAGTSSAQPAAPAAAAAGDVAYGSTSTLSPETATGWHVLKVEDYSRTKDDLDSADYVTTAWHVTSTAFTVGGYAWRITYSPAGLYRDTAGAHWICFGLSLEPPAAGPELDVNVRIRYSLLDPATGQPLPSSVRTDGVRTLSSLLQYRTYTPFMERERFESSSYLKDDGFTVRCDVTLLRKAWTCRLSGVVPPPYLRRHMGDLLATGVGADVTLEVGGEAFAAHRSVLAARSPVFKAELLGGTPDKEDAAGTSSRVKIHGIEPSEFRALLHFIYTDSLPEIDAGDETVMARRLLVAAQRYGLEGLRCICEDILCIACPLTTVAKESLSLSSRPAVCNGWPV